MGCTVHTEGVLTASSRWGPLRRPKPLIFFKQSSLGKNAEYFPYCLRDANIDQGPRSAVPVAQKDHR